MNIDATCICLPKTCCQVTAVKHSFIELVSHQPLADPLCQVAVLLVRTILRVGLDWRITYALFCDLKGLLLVFPSWAAMTLLMVVPA